MVARNPFKPTAGATPPYLVGREDVLQEYEESLEDGPGAPARLARFTGPRGVGKTVMLTAVADLAGSHGWETVAETATPGFVPRLTDGMVALARSGKYRSIEGTDEYDEKTGLRGAFNLLLSRLDLKGSGLLITIDEVHSVARADLRELAAAYQHLVADKRNVSLVFAGLPSAVHDLLNDQVLTFLRRATPFELTDVPLPAVRDAFLSAIQGAGKEITNRALDALTTATGGYPFMIQLVGYHVWRNASENVIDLDAVEVGVAAARVRLGNTVHATALNDLSDVDRTYLIAMAQDDGPSRTNDVARRMNVGMNYASVYRTRLIAAGVIRPEGHGRVNFALPYLREYLRTHAAHLEMATREEGLAEEPPQVFSGENRSANAMTEIVPEKSYD